METYRSHGSRQGIPAHHWNTLDCRSGLCVQTGQCGGGGGAEWRWGEGRTFVALTEVTGRIYDKNSAKALAATEIVFEQFGQPRECTRRERVFGSDKLDELIAERLQLFLHHRECRLLIGLNRLTRHT